MMAARPLARRVLWHARPEQRPKQSVDPALGQCGHDEQAVGAFGERKKVGVRGGGHTGDDDDFGSGG